MNEKIELQTKKSKSKITVKVSIPKRFYARDEKISFSIKQAEEKAKSLLTNEEEVITLLSGPNQLCNWQSDLTSGVWVFEVRKLSKKVSTKKSEQE